MHKPAFHLAIRSPVKMHAAAYSCQVFQCCSHNDTTKVTFVTQDSCLSRDHVVVKEKKMSLPAGLCDFPHLSVKLSSQL